MKIVIYANGLDHPDVPTLSEALGEIPFEVTTDRPLGPISAQPCVCALYDNGLVAWSWSALPLDIEAIEAASSQDGTPPESEEPAPVEPTKADLLAKVQDLMSFVQALPS